MRDMLTGATAFYRGELNRAKQELAQYKAALPEKRYEVHACIVASMQRSVERASAALAALDTYNGHPVAALDDASAKALVEAHGFSVNPVPLDDVEGDIADGVQAVAFRIANQPHQLAMGK